MRGSLRIGRVFGFPVELHFTFLVLLGLAAVLGGLEMAGMLLLVFASVLVHEVGHSLVARGFGVPILGITLMPFGGMARMAGQPGPRQELLIAVAGPATSLLIASFATMAWQLTGVTMLGVLASINFVLGIFNLLPALPMDGGRILRAALVPKMGEVRATMLAGRIARVLAVGLAVSVFWLGPMALIIALLVWWMAGQEMAQARAKAYVEQVRKAQAEGAVSGMPFGADLASLFEELRSRSAARPRPRGHDDPRVPASRVIIDVPPSK